MPQLGSTRDRAYVHMTFQPFGKFGQITSDLSCLHGNTFYSGAETGKTEQTEGEQPGKQFLFSRGVIVST